MGKGINNRIVKMMWSCVQWINHKFQPGHQNQTQRNGLKRKNTPDRNNNEGNHTQSSRNSQARGRTKRKTENRNSTVKHNWFTYVSTKQVCPLLVNKSTNSRTSNLSSSFLQEGSARNNPTGDQIWNFLRKHDFCRLNQLKDSGERISGAGLNPPNYTQVNLAVMICTNWSLPVQK